MTVLHVVLESLNEKVCEMASKKVIDFDRSWTLFPTGSFAVFEDCEMTHIVQVVDNSVETTTTGSRVITSISLEFSFYGFDGYNIGTYANFRKLKDFPDHVTVASLRYRPLRFEERVKPLVVRDAIEFGRKVLGYQGCHYCHYAGSAYPTSASEDLGASKTEVRVNRKQNHSKLY